MIINVQRQNTDGRVIVKIIKYKKGDYFIPKDIEKNQRNIEVTFEAKIQGKPLNFHVVFVKHNSYAWLTHEAKFIDHPNWHLYKVQKTIDSNEDFVVRIEEKECSNLPCNYQIRRIIIKEIV